MRIIDCVQGTDAWRKARLGIPTASQFHRIITATGKPSAQAEAYLYELAAEYILQEPCNSVKTEWMARGTFIEEEARRYYELQRDVNVEQVGFVTTDDGLIGCSPDGLIGDDGGVEIKVPSAARHIAYLLSSPADDYKFQVQGSLYVTGRAWWDIVSYNPAMPSTIVRCERDEGFIKLLDKRMQEFTERLTDCIVKLKDMGINQVKEEIDEELEALFPD